MVVVPSASPMALCILVILVLRCLSLSEIGFEEEFEGGWGNNVSLCVAPVTETARLGMWTVTDLPGPKKKKKSLMSWQPE